MGSSLQNADYIVLGGFFVVMLGVGVVYARRMRNLRDFFGGGRHVPWWLAGTSLYMTTFSAFAFVSYSALAYRQGLVAIAIWWFSIPGCLLSAHFLASRWRRAATTSPLEYLETRFGPVLRQCFSWFGVPLIVLDDALKLFVIGTMVSVSLGLEGPSGHAWAIAVCGFIMVLYTLLGGLWAVLVTDFIQFIVMALAVIVLAPLALSRAGGLGLIGQQAPEDFFHVSSGSYTWPWLLSFAVLLALTYATKWPYVQRYYVVRSDREARWVGYLVAGLTFIGPPMLFFPAGAARVFLPGVENANDVYPLLCRALLPVGMMGIVIAAMFSATMSMLSSDYNAVASVITNDVIKRLFLPRASDRALVVLARLSTLAAGCLAMLVAVVLTQVEGLEDLVKIMARLFAVLLPPVALPMLAGLLSRRASNAGALAGFVAGAVCGIAAYALSYRVGLGYLRTIPYLTWITLLPTAAGLVIASAVRPNNAQRQEAVTAFLGGLGRRMVLEKPELGQGDDVRLAMRIIGGICAFLGTVLATASLLSAGWASAWVSVVSGLALLGVGASALVASMERP